MKKIDELLEILGKIYQLLKVIQLPENDRLIQLTEEETMTRQQVKDYLGISESTYIRKVKDGTLKPIKMPGGDRFYKKNLVLQFNESKRRGRL